jgi:hypothetical protein
LPGSFFQDFNDEDENLHVVFNRVASFGKRSMVASTNGRRHGEGSCGSRTAMAPGTKANNPDLIAPPLADKIVVTEADGKVLDKAGILAFYKKTKWDSAEYNDVKVTVFGDTAIATGGFKGKGSDAAGKPFDNNERRTNTWTKMPSGKWQCAASHASPAKA